jgi:zinc protease
MKSTRYILFGVLALLTGTLFGQVDRSRAPQPGPAPRINIGKYEGFKLKNGMQVFVVSNNKLPMVSISLVFDVDARPEGEKTGLSELFGEMLQAGTTKMSKDEFDDAIDFIGARMSAGSSGVYINGVSRQTGRMIELISDMVRNPAFKEEELERIRKQAISGLVSGQTDPGTIARNMMAVANFGTAHPYGEITTEETLNNITVEDFKQYHQENYTPSIAYLAVVGDIDVPRAKALIEQYFGDWAATKPARFNPPAAAAPAVSRVYLHDLETAVQSTIRLTYPIPFTPGSKDRIAVSVLSNILGGGSTGRLYKNLREGKGYTYGAYCGFIPDKNAGRFVVSTDVKTSVTDSAVYEIIFELNRLLSEGVTQKELDGVKKEMTGSFARSLEDPQTIANFAINTARYKLPKDYYETYLQSLNALTLEDIRTVIRKYILPFNYNLVVVGRRDSIEQGLVQYNRDGKITFLDAFGKPARALMEAPEGVTAQAVIEGYLNAIGGIEAIAGIQDLTTKMTGVIQGQTLSLEEYFKSPGKSLQLVKFGAMEVDRTQLNGDKGKSGGAELSGNKLADQKATVHPVFEYNVHLNRGVKAELEGVALIKGTKTYQVKFTRPSGEVERRWYHQTKFTLVRSRSTQTSDQGTISITTDYRGQMEVAGVLFPAQMQQQIGPQELKVVVESMEANTGLSDDIFK